MIRAITGRPRSAFLTFDDGPDDCNTELILDVLRDRNAKATFFLVGSRIRGRESLVSRMVQEGHALGNHSWDHQYRNYFRSRETLREWIVAVDREFKRIGLGESVGFRPPAGIVTPILKPVLRDLDEPLVLWNERFYDAVRPWTRAKASRSADRLVGGSVILLHDRRRSAPDSEFCRTLEFYIDRILDRGLKLDALSRILCEGGTYEN